MNAFLQAIDTFFKGVAGEILLVVLFCLMALPSIVVLVVLERKNNALIIKHGTFGYKRHKRLGERLGIALMLATFVLFIALAWLIKELVLNDWIALPAMAILGIVYCLPRIIFELVFYCRVKKRAKLSQDSDNNATTDKQCANDQQSTNELTKE